MGVVKKQTVIISWLNSAANAGTLEAGDFYVTARDGTYQATSSSEFIKIQNADIPPLPDFGSAAFAETSDFATKAQGAKADTALQQVKTINGQSIVGTGDIVISSDAQLWVSGTAYPINTYVVSPLSSHVYMKRTATAASAVDPANDQTNWRLIGAGGLKSVQKGILSIGNTVTSAAATISAVNPAACTVSVIASSTNSQGALSTTYTLSATSLEIQKSSSITGSGTAQLYAWTIAEYWS